MQLPAPWANTRVAFASTGLDTKRVGETTYVRVEKLSELLLPHLKRLQVRREILRSNQFQYSARQDEKSIRQSR